jgi:carbon-monoxide dehydrogenase medium subunit
MIPAALDYVRASTIEEALEALAAGDRETRALAGGQSLIPLLKLRIARPEAVVDIGRLDLRGLRVNGAVEIGALTRYDEVARSTAPQALVEAARSVGDLQVRNAGTIGGGLAHADPASDVGAAMIALGARVRVRSLRGEREIDIDDFYAGPFTTALEPGELVLGVTVAPSRSAYVSVRHPASGYPVAGAAVGRPDGSWRVGLTGVSSAPVRAHAVEELLAQSGPEPALDEIRDALAGVEVTVPDDEYARHLCAVVVRDAARAVGAS